MSNGNREEPKHLTGSTILTHCQAGMCCQRFSRKGGRLCPRPQLRRTSVAFQLISRRAGNLDRKALRSYTHTFWKGKPENVPFHLLEGKVVSPSGACVHLIGRSEDLLRLDPILGSENWHIPPPAHKKHPIMPNGSNHLRFISTGCHKTTTAAAATTTTQTHLQLESSSAFPRWAGKMSHALVTSLPSRT